jgi:hypothetical protein
MAFGGIRMAGAARLAALHPPLQNGSLAEVLQSLQLLSEFPELPGVAILGGRTGRDSRSEHDGMDRRSSPTVIIP